MEFLETYLPFAIALFFPLSYLSGYLTQQWAVYTGSAQEIAPPSPPSLPDFNGWMHKTELSFYDFALAEPIIYLVVDLGLGFAIGALVLFWKDISEWLERRRLRAQRGSYQKLEDEEEAEKEEVGAMSSTELRMQLNKTVCNVDEVRREHTPQTLPLSLVTRLAPKPRPYMTAPV